MIRSLRVQETIFGAKTPRTQPRLGRHSHWVLDGYDPAHVSEDGVALSIKKKNIVRLDTLIASGTYEILFKLEHDIIDSGVCGFGLVKHDLDLLALSREFSTDVKVTHENLWHENLWWLRRFHCMVYSGTSCEGGEGAFSTTEFPVGATVRIVVDMEKGEATFFVNDTKLKHKAKNITGPVYPCALSYRSFKEGGFLQNYVKISIVHVKRTSK